MKKRSGLTEIKDTELSDDTFHIPAQIVIILGEDVYYDIVLPVKFSRVQGFGIVETIFGKAVAGTLPEAAVKDVFTQSEEKSKPPKSNFKLENIEELDELEDLK